MHGGSSLQEMLIPVVEVTTNTRYVEYDYVDVILTSVNRKVTNLITYFDFIQTEKVSLERTECCYIRIQSCYIIMFTMILIWIP